MNLADKLCYPQNSDFEHSNEELDGLTFRERLIIALAGNPALVTTIDESEKDGLISCDVRYMKADNTHIIDRANDLLKQLEEGK